MNLMLNGIEAMIETRGILVVTSRANGPQLLLQVLARAPRCPRGPRGVSRNRPAVGP